jgi:site-specific DNA-methyltransferase (adenine-specific)
VIHRGDSLAFARTLDADSVDAIITDPPYFKVKGEAWDRQWDKPHEFLAWLGEHLAEWHRILRANGSLYVFASPRMSARVEVLIGERFEVLNHIVWLKHDNAMRRHAAQVLDAGNGRRWFPDNERLIFAEHRGADGYALGESSYGQKCDELRGFVFEPLRAYLAGERDRAGVTTRQVAEAFQRKTGSRTVTGMAGHWFERVQWSLPTEENYEWLRRTLSSLNGKGDYLRREYEDLRREYEDLRREYEDLRREYEDLRREYEDLRRPFNVSPDVPYTDVWTFPTVSDYPGKHPCEKPLAMLEHIINASTKPGAVVFDPFCGSGTCGVAAIRHGREFIGCDTDARWCRRAEARLAEAPVLFMQGVTECDRHRPTS